MRNNKQYRVAIPAEEKGWQLWTGDMGSPVRLADELLMDIPEADQVYLPIADMVTIPLRLPLGDFDEYRDAALLELEGLGLINSDEEIRHYDVVELSVKEDAAFLAVHCLLGEGTQVGELADGARFDFSARHLGVSRDEEVCVLLREHGMWWMVFYRAGEPILTELLGDQLGDLKSCYALMVAQLSLRGFDFDATLGLVYGDSVDNLALVEYASALGFSFEKKAFEIPQAPQQLLVLEPSSATVIKGSRARRKRMKLIGMAVVAAYVFVGIAIVATLVVQRLSVDKKQAELELYLPDWQENEAHFQLWNELDDLVTSEWPMALYSATVSCLKNVSGVQFEEVTARPRFIEIRGSAARASDLNIFKQKLRAEPMFDEYDWLLGQPKKSAKTQRWEFKFRAELKEL